MKLFRWGDPGQERPGILDAQGRYRDLTAVVSDVDRTTLAPEILDSLRGVDPQELPEIPQHVRVGPCVDGVRNFFAIGLNYADHARESGMSVPEEPIVFNKSASSVCGPFDDVLIPPGSRKTDWEVELAVLIGSRVYAIDESEAMGAIAGYCVCNDLSERHFQLERGGQWIKGKSFPTFGPLGPYLVTCDEVDDIHDLSIWLELNEERVQDSSTSQMIFSVTEIVAYLSQCMILEPGDVITTGTPPGIGMGRTPPRYLRSGDVLRCGIEGLGWQEQVCKSGDEVRAIP